jgi:hypothetical protein
MRKFFVGSLIAMGLLAGEAYAGCWMQCVLAEPFTGKCLMKTKMCNVEDSKKAAESLGRDVGAAIRTIENNWKQIYGQLPGELKDILGRYPLTFLSLVFPGTREYVLLGYALDEVKNRAQARGRAVKNLMATMPPWKHETLLKGLKFLTEQDFESVAIHDWENNPENYNSPNFRVPWWTFVDCVDAANNITESGRCFRKFQRDVINASI